MGDPASDDDYTDGGAGPPLDARPPDAIAPHAIPPGALPPTADPAHSRTTIVAIIISVFLMGAGMGLQGSAVSLRAGIEGFSESMVGLVMSLNYLGLIVGSMIAPMIIRNVGYVRSFAVAGQPLMEFFPPSGFEVFGVTAILWSVGGAAVMAALIALFRPGGGGLYVLVFLFGGLGMPVYSLSGA